MKHRNILERRKEREEFVYKYRAEIAAFIKLGGKHPDTIFFFNTVARTQLEYSCKTATIDIYLITKRTYAKLEILSVV